MNRADLTEIISTSGGISKTQASIVLQTLVDAATEAFKRGERITVAGFGTLVPARRRARNGRNPRTGELLRIKARRTVRFSPGLELRQAISEK